MRRMRTITLSALTAAVALALPASAAAVDGDQTVTSSVAGSLAITPPATTNFPDVVPGTTVEASGEVAVVSTLACYNLTVKDASGNGKMKQINAALPGADELSNPLQWKLLKINLVDQTNSYADLPGSTGTAGTVDPDGAYTNTYTMGYKQQISSNDQLALASVYDLDARYTATAC